MWVTGARCAAGWRERENQISQCCPNKQGPSSSAPTLQPHATTKRPKQCTQEGQGGDARPAPSIGRRVLGKRPSCSPPGSQYSRRAPRARGGLGAVPRVRAPHWHCDGHLPHVFAQKPLGKSTDACRIQPTSHLPNAFCWSQV